MTLSNTVAKSLVFVTEIVKKWRYLKKKFEKKFFSVIFSKFLEYHTEN